MFNFGLQLMSTPSDGAVYAGIGIMILYVVLAFYIVRYVFRRAKAKVKEMHTNHMHTIALVLVLGAASLLTTGCYTVVPPGHVGILVEQTGTDRGVQDIPVKTGRVFYNPWNENVLSYPTSVQRVIWTVNKSEGKEINEEINYNSKDQLVFTGDFTVAYELVAEKVPHFYVKFRNDDIDAFTHGFFRDQVRDALNEAAVQYTADDLYGSKKEEFRDKALERVRSKVLPFGVNVISLGYASSPRPPQQVADAINSKIAAIQKATQTENEIRQTEAEARKKVADAEGTAKSNDIVTKSISPQMMAWQQLKVQQSAIEKWDGHMPQYSGGGALPFIQIPMKQQQQQQ